MAAKKKVAKAGSKAGKAAVQARYNPYVQRLIDDEDLRANLVEAYESSKAAYGRLSNGKSATSQIFDDKKLQKELKNAAESLRDASVALREAPKKRRSGGARRVVVLALVGASACIALSKRLRKKLLDTLFGTEEAFQYTSSTTSSAPAAGAPAGT